MFAHGSNQAVTGLGSTGLIYMRIAGTTISTCDLTLITEAAILYRCLGT